MSAPARSTTAGLTPKQYEKVLVEAHEEMVRGGMEPKRNPDCPVCTSVDPDTYRRLLDLGGARS